MIWAYRTLLTLNVIVCAVSLFMALPTLANLIDRGPTTFNTFVAAWPLPQMAGLWFGGKIRERGDLGGACWMLLGQFVVVFGLMAGALLLVLAAMPE